MTVILRDRPDGAVEILLMDPIILEVVANREMARFVCTYIGATELEVPELGAFGFATAAADVAESEAEALALAVAVEQSPPQAIRTVRKPRANLPAVIKEGSSAPARIEHHVPARLTDEQLSAAFRRIVDGEKIAAIAPDFALTMGQLRGIWANHRRNMQSHIAEGGQKACVLCRRAFTPSLTHPDTCARCNHG
ncbi:hypothetical protein [Gemmobacter sp.]|uniref:hypothetical protein n=1 Tax=Gemmobacter sp. TaxID=1898957 RepID=UPI002B000AB1|nr:hypothetical protein [Gemmobacter sp.]